MSAYFNFIKSDRIIFYSFLSSLSIFLITLIYAFFFLSKLPPLIPIFNQMPWGETRVGTKFQLFLPLLVVAIVVISNSVLGMKLHESTPLLSRVASVAGLLISFLALLYVVRTIALLL